MKKSLVYYSISMFSGCLSTLLLINNVLIGAAFAASFLAAMIFTVNRKYFYIIIIFFIIGALNYYQYFNIAINQENYIKIRVTEIDKFNAEGVAYGRRLTLSGNINNLTAGESVYINGDFKKIPDYEKGIIGEYTIRDIKNRNHDFIYRLYELRSSIYERYKISFGEKNSGVIAAACFGDVSHLDKEQKTDLNKLGIVHIVSVSGLHMALIYKVLEGIIGFKASLVVSFLYVIFTGAQASTVRSFIMILILKLSKKFYKKYDNISSLSFAAVILLTWRPFYILDMGFMLSFLSVFGITVLFDRLKRKFFWLPKFLNESVSLTLSAQSFSVPYALICIKSFSTGFMSGNIFLLPLYSALVVSGNASLIFIKVNPVFNLLNHFTYLIITAINGGTYILLKISPPIMYFSITQVMGIVTIYISYLMYKNGRKQFLFLPVLMIFIIFFDNYKIFPELDYMNVNNHIAVIVRYKGQSAMIFDRSGTYLKDEDKLRGTYNVDKIEAIDSDGLGINLDSGYRIRLYRLYDSSKRYTIDMEFINGNKKTLVTTQKMLSDGPYYYNYDIIYLKNGNSRKSFDGKVMKIAVVRIFFNKVYVIS